MIILKQGDFFADESPRLWMTVLVLQKRDQLPSVACCPTLWLGGPTLTGTLIGCRDSQSRSPFLALASRDVAEKAGTDTSTTSAHLTSYPSSLTQRSLLHPFLLFPISIAHALLLIKSFTIDALSIANAPSLPSIPSCLPSSETAIMLPLSFSDLADSPTIVTSPHQHQFDPITSRAAHSIYYHQKSCKPLMPTRHWDHPSKSQWLFWYLCLISSLLLYRKDAPPNFGDSLVPHLSQSASYFASD